MFLACYYYIRDFIWHRFMQVGRGKAGAEGNFAQNPCPPVPVFSVLLINYSVVWRPAEILEKKSHHQSFQTSERRQNASVRTPASALQGPAAPEQTVLALSRENFVKKAEPKPFQPSFTVKKKPRNTWCEAGRREQTSLVCVKLLPLVSEVC